MSAREWDTADGRSFINNVKSKPDQQKQTAVVDVNLRLSK